MQRRAFLTSIAAITQGCGSSEAPVVPAPTKKRKLVMYGDSITNQAGQIIEQFLPGWEVVNLGVDASILADVIKPMMVFDPDTVYSFSYGANECLGQRISVEDYWSSWNHVASQAKAGGRNIKVVFEAPWLLLDPRCNPYIEAYRAEVLRVGKAYGIPVVIENNQDHIGEGIHLTQAHMTARAALLAAEVLKI